MVSNAILETPPSVARPERLGRAETPLSREQVMERIMSINPTATVHFLGRFADRALRGYLDHLSMVQEPRGRCCQPWVRPGDSPAIVVRIPDE